MTTPLNSRHIPNSKPNRQRTRAHPHIVAAGQAHNCEMVGALEIGRSSRGRDRDLVRGNSNGFSRQGPNFEKRQIRNRRCATRSFYASLVDSIQLFPIQPTESRTDRLLALGRHVCRLRDRASWLSHIWQHHRAYPRSRRTWRSRRWHGDRNHRPRHRPVNDRYNGGLDCLGLYPYDRRSRLPWPLPL